MLFRSVVALVAIQLLAGTSFSRDSEPNRRGELNTYIPLLIELLEKKEYETFIKLFVHPKDRGNQTVEEVVEKFSDKEAGRILSVLKQTQGVKPDIYADGVATFRFKKGSGSISFKKIEKYWYLFDGPPPKR